MADVSLNKRMGITLEGNFVNKLCGLLGSTDGLRIMLWKECSK
jgi:hypothetical protein